MKTNVLLGAAAFALVLASVPVVAQMKHGEMDHSGHGMGQGEMKGEMQGDGMGQMTMGEPKGDSGEASKAYAAANARMHADMDITFSGDADVDFVKGMIAHHQGAIDMAEVQLKYGKDPEIRSLAEGIIKAQRGEIAMMQNWLADKGK
jgi:uncharacterized protein (DUF305 family)